MCDGKHSSKRDVVILSIKPKRPEYLSGQKFVPVSELLQEWDKLDAYYRGQLLKLTKSLSKSNANKHSKSSRHSISKSSPNSNDKVNKLNKPSCPVHKKHSSSLSSDQFTDLFGDENLFNHNVVPTDSNNNTRHHKLNKLLHSRSLNSLFDEDSLDNLSPPPVVSQNSQSRKNSLVVSIPVLSVQQNGDTYNKKYKYASDDESCSSSEDEEQENFLSVPRGNFQVQYGTKQKTRVALLENGDVSPKWIIPIHVAPYKPPTAQGLNGVQIQKILYHKNDSVNYASPTTTSARTPDKPPENSGSQLPPPATKSAKVSSNSPVSTVSPRSTISSGSSNNGSPPSMENNNATPKQVSSPELSPPPKSDQGSRKPSPTSTKLLSPPVNFTTVKKQKRPANGDGYSNGFGHGKKYRHGGENHSALPSPSSGFNMMPVTSTSSTFSFSSSSSSSSSGDNDYQTEDDLSSRVKAHDMTTTNGNKTDTAISPKKLNIIKKSPTFLKPASVAGDNSGSAVFIQPAAVSITERIIKKASQPQPELLERQRRRKLESNQRKSYAMQKGDEHEERESIDLSMKSFEMIWNVPLLSPLRSP